MRRDRGDSCSVSRITLSPHTGAHVDAPLHVLDGTGGAEDRTSADVGSLALDSFIGPCRVFCISSDEAIARRTVESLPLAGVSRALFRTRAQANHTVFPSTFAHFSADAAEFLAAHVRLVGIDTPSVDRWDSKDLPAHRALFARGVAVLEGLDLTEAADGEYELIALPLRLTDLDGSPVRAVLRTL
jgi:arylformamidase